MRVLGLSAYYHDSAAVLLAGGRVVGAAQLERFTRRKHDAAFPTEVIAWLQQAHGLRLHTLDAIAYYEKPLLKFERLLETFYAGVPQGWGLFVRAMPTWVQHKLMLRHTLQRALHALDPALDFTQTPLYFAEHHLSHAASAFYASPFERAAIVTIDGVGEWATATIGVGDATGIRVLREMRFPQSLGLFYSAVTSYLGFRVLSGEYKLMGLAPYGNGDSERVRHYEQVLSEQLLTLYQDGSIWLNPDYFSFTDERQMYRAGAWQRALGLPPRRAEGPLEQAHADLALAAQRALEGRVLRMADYARRLTELPDVVLAGGVALNCVANARLRAAETFARMYVQPASGDGGGALGAAYAAHHIVLGQPRVVPSDDPLRGGALGPSYDEEEVMAVARRYGARTVRYDSLEQLCRVVALRLSEGAVVGWCQGAAEWGPRALGRRSILADARRSDIQAELNARVKKREAFRPFAPAVRWERAREAFELTEPSPYMLFTAPVNHAQRKKRPGDWAALDLEQKRTAPRSTWPGVVHVDYSARVQTVHRETNAEFWALLEAFERVTDCPVLVNTSFNLRGEPMVLTPDDAYRCFRRAGLDLLVWGLVAFDLREQPPWTEPEAELALD